MQRTISSAFVTSLLAGIWAMQGCGGATNGEKDGQPSVGLNPASSSCTNSAPVEMAGSETRLELCAEGTLHRVGSAVCAHILPREGRTVGEWLDPYERECREDDDCTSAPLGHCEMASGQVPRTVCLYACATDGDCPSGQICECGEAYGTCRPADCQSTADCGASELCARHTDRGRCSDGEVRWEGYLCTTPEDECRQDEDCETDEVCGEEDGQRRCLEHKLCGIGRPFLVAGEPRLAAVEARDDWAVGEAGNVAGLTAEQAQRVADEWTRIARMEHASVAAFARFALQLLSVGAPPELLERCQRAMADELRHAQVCFGLASSYAGQALGPGPLALDDAAIAEPMASIVVSVFLEGCVGETIAALEAQWAAEHADGEELQAVLAGIAREEKEHAELAWRFTAWALARHPELRQELAAVADSLRGPADEGAGIARCSEDEWLVAHGIVPEAVRGALRQHALDYVVRPCLTQVLRGAGAAADNTGAAAPRLGAQDGPSTHVSS